MGAANGSVLSYKTLYMPIYFPEGELACQYCVACRKDNNNDNHFCRLTGEMLLNIKAGIGNECRLCDIEK